MKKIPDKFTLVKSPKKAAELLRFIRWKGKVYCPHCGCVNDIIPHGKNTSGIYRYFCHNCDHTFSDTTGTPFARSKVSLWKWMYVLIILFEATGSLSAAEVSRTIKVSYKTAHTMMKKIRQAVEWDRYEGELKGIIESDETWISHQNNQQIIQGIVARDNEVRFFPVKDTTEVSLTFPLIKYVQKGSFLCTDGHFSYSGMGIRFVHHTVNHSHGEFVWRDVFTNTIEGVWSMLKGILRTIHHGVWKRYLLDYCNLFAFMYSNRHLNSNDKFTLLLLKLCQPRYCTY